MDRVGLQPGGAQVAAPGRRYPGRPTTRPAGVAGTGGSRPLWHSMRAEAACDTATDSMAYAAVRVRAPPATGSGPAHPSAPAPPRGGRPDAGAGEPGR